MAAGYADMHFVHQVEVATAAREQGLSLMDVPGGWAETARRAFPLRGGAARQLPPQTPMADPLMQQHNGMWQAGQPWQQQQLGTYPPWYQQYTAQGAAYSAQRGPVQQVPYTPAEYRAGTGGTPEAVRSERRFARIEAALQSIAAANSPAGPLRQPNFDDPGIPVVAPLPPPAHHAAPPMPRVPQQAPVQPVPAPIPGPPPAQAQAAGAAAGGGVAPAGGGAAPTLFQALSALTKPELEGWRSRVNADLKKTSFNGWYQEGGAKREFAIRQLASLLELEMGTRQLAWTTLAALEAAWP
jgi:hypothetical protein